jgi:hypothetical protein
MSTNEKAEVVLAVIRQLAKWVLKGVGLFFLIIILLYLIYKGYQAWDDRPIVLRSLKGIELNQSASDFLFKNEKFEKVKTEDNVVIYESEMLNVGFKENKVSDISLFCFKGDFVFIDSDANGISCGGASENILSKYGDKVKIYCDKNNSRIYAIPSHNVYYYLTANKIQVIQVSNLDFKFESTKLCSK